VTIIIYVYDANIKAGIIDSSQILLADAEWTLKWYKEPLSGLQKN
jgi:hypothetical protein